MLPNLTLTFVLEHQGTFLVVKRADTEDHFPGQWAFPGGKCEVGETVVDTLRREIQEETSLLPSDKYQLLDAYAFGSSTGLCFLIQVTSKDIHITDASDFRWIRSLEEFRQLSPRIPGVDNHLVAAVHALQEGHWSSLESLQLTPEKYLNQE